MKAAWLWLDFLIFGNGFGMASPYHDDTFYWLSGDLYTFQHGFGAQLRSRQWTHPKAGERRTLAGHEFVIFQSTRSGLRVECSWGLVRLDRDVTEANLQIDALKTTLNNL